jgi:hypothetical protein
VPADTLPSLPATAATWSPDQALAFVARLDDLIAAVWALHGEAMAAVLRQRVEAQISAVVNRAG